MGKMSYVQRSSTSQRFSWSGGVRYGQGELPSPSPSPRSSPDSSPNPNRNQVVTLGERRRAGSGTLALTVAQALNPL